MRREAVSDAGGKELLGTQWAKATAEAYKKASSPTTYNSEVASRLVQTYDTIGASDTAIGLESTISAGGDAAKSSALAISSALVSGKNSGCIRCHVQAQNGLVPIKLKASC